VKQAPSWNAVVQEFGGHPDVVFGDVALSKNQVRDIHGTGQNPGAGGWPTVRIFTKETGYGGKAYEKKTSMAMCDELGPKEQYMKELVLGAKLITHGLVGLLGVGLPTIPGLLVEIPHCRPTSGSGTLIRPMNGTNLVLG